MERNEKRMEKEKMGNVGIDDGKKTIWIKEIRRIKEVRASYWGSIKERRTQSCWIEKRITCCY